MKKLYLFLLTLISSFAFSQNPNYYYNSWRLGINFGGMWQTSDLTKNTAGFAGGFTLEKGIAENEKHFFSLAIRGRALFGGTYGYSGKKNYNIAGNPALNGTYNSSINYSDSSANKFIYDNYKTQISEGALELQLSFNRLRERTHVILNVWGGIGFSVFRTNTNLTDANGKLYDFSKADSTGSAQNAALSQKSLLDQSYESYAKGSKAGDLLTLSPSAGIGLGYQFSKNFSMIWEYKVTFPMGLNADLLDGVVGTNNHWLAGNNDFYHYTGVNLLFTLGRGKRTRDTTAHSNVNNYNPATTNTVMPNYNNNTNPVLNGYPMASQGPPVVNIINPPYSPFVSNTAPFTVHAKVYNVRYASELNVNYNGQQITNYSFSGDDLYFQVTLSPGNNTAVITATNRSGSDSKSAVISLQGEPPIVSIVNPGVNPYNTGSNLINVTAGVLNVSSSNDIMVSYNGVPVNYFWYDMQSKQLSIQLVLLEGNNTLEVAASNAYGRDSKVTTIIYSPPPVVKSNFGGIISVAIVDPATNPYTVKTASYPVAAKVTGSTPQTQVSVQVNGNPVNFNFNAGTGDVSFMAPLNLGANNVVVSARKARSSDSKSTVIIYEQDRAPMPPKVTVTAPLPSPQIVTHGNYVFKAIVTHITSTSQLEVKFNSQIVNNYSFDAYNGIVEFSTNLASGNNVFEVSATNPDGTDKGSGVVNFIENKVSGEKLKEICIQTAYGFETITIIEHDWPSYQAQGATEGPCQVGLSVGTASVQQITICHHNPDGTRQNIQIPQSQWSLHQSHGDTPGTCPQLGNPQGTSLQMITICHHTADGSLQTIQIPQSQWSLHSAHGDTPGDCPQMGNPQSTDVQITICHHNPDGSRQTIQIPRSQWSTHQSHGDTEGACPQMGNPQGEDMQMITICHHNTDGSHQTIQIPQSQWSLHQAHGDTQGACPQMGDPQSSDLQITICHHSPDGTRQTIQIPRSQWAAHQAHGDTEGSCPQMGDPQSGDIQVTICHHNSDGSRQTIQISQSQLGSHLAHGDTQGSCPQMGDPQGSDLQITICHHNTDGSRQTIQIPRSQWAIHQSHGDTQGACPQLGDPQSGDIQVTICHHNADGSRQTIQISQSQLGSHLAHGDIQGSCPQMGDPQSSDLQITICHHNTDGTKQTIQIPRTQWAIHQSHGDTQGACPQTTTGNGTAGDQMITICHHKTDGSKQTITIPSAAWPTHQAHGDTQGECPANTEQTGTGGDQFKICHKNADGTYQNIIISPSDWGIHRSHGDHMGECTAQETDPAITICHFPGNNQPAQTVTIPQSAWPAHQAHGDHMGSCSASEMNPTVVICHFPGNNQPAQQMTIPQNLWPSHQAHGDHMGNCSGAELSPQQARPNIINQGPRINQQQQQQQIQQPQQQQIQQPQQSAPRQLEQPQQPSNPENGGGRTLRPR